LGITHRQEDIVTLHQLGQKLNEMYFSADDGETAAMVHLFGIKYATEINELGAAMKSIAKAAGIRESYGTEISKGVKLAKYVTVKQT
jgi:5-methylcytosine-specific restriction protein B